MIKMNNTSVFRWYLYTHHQSFGVLMSFFLFLGLMTRFLVKYLASYKSLSRPMSIAALTTHALLYLAIFSLIVRGYLQGVPYGATYLEFQYRLFVTNFMQQVLASMSTLCLVKRLSF